MQALARSCKLTIPKFQICVNTFSSLSNLPSDSEQIYVVSGASKGLGLEFTKQLLERTSARVIGLSRTPGSNHSRFHWIPMDLEDQDSIDNAAQELKVVCDRIDLLLNVAGILGDNSVSQPGPERSVTQIDREWLRKTFEVNLFGHVLLTKELIPLIKTAGNGQPLSNGVKSFPKIINMSARVGSIGDNKLGGWYSYRMSKAALNMFTKTLSLEMQRSKCIVTSLHPGTNDTLLSKPFQKNVNPSKLFEPSYSVDLMLQKIWSLQPQDTGKFFAYNGEEIPW